MSDSRWSSQPCGVAKRASSAHSGRPMARARSGHWCARSTCSMNQPSAARKPWRIPGHGRAHRHAHGPEVRHDVEHRHQGVEHGDVDALAPAGAVALAQGGLGADDGEERGHDVAEAAHGRADRRLALGALELVGAAHGLDDGGQRGPAGVGGVGGARRDRRGRSPRWRGRRRRGARPPRPRSPGRGAQWPRRGSSRRRRRSVAPGCRTRSRPAGCLRSTTIERLDRLLRRKVAPTARPSGSVSAGEARAPEVTRAGRLDLDHLGAEAPQQLRGVGQRLHLLEGENAHAGERLAPVRRLRD